MALSERELRLAQLYRDSSDLIKAIIQFRPGRRARVAAMSQDNNYEGALEALRALSEEEGIPMAIVGGAAAIHHGYPRFTEDIDIVVKIKDFDRIITSCYKYGIDIVSFNPTGFHELNYKGVKIEVLQEGSFGHDEDDPEWVPSPEELGVNAGLGFTSLVGLIRLKLGAARMQDEADIVEVLKNTSPEKIREVQEFLAGFGHGFLERFENLLGRAMKEKQKRVSFWGK